MGKRPELEAAKFDRHVCVRGTFDSDQGFYMLSLGEGIEEKYMGDEIIRRDGKSTDCLASMIPVTQELTQRILSGEELTDEEIERIREARKESQELFGPRVMDIARKAGIAQTLTPGEAFDLVKILYIPDKDALVSYAESGFSHWPSKNWAILETRDSDPVLAILKEGDEEGSKVFEVAHLDQVFEANPAALKQLIRDFHEKHAKSTLIGSATYMLAIHEVAARDVVPEFMVRLGEIDDPEQRAQEAAAILAFMVATVRIEGGPNQVWHFQDGMRRVQTPIEGGQRHVYTNGYLGHLAACPTQPDLAQGKLAEMLWFYNKIQEIDVHEPALTPEQNPDVAVLREPDRMTFYSPRGVGTEERRVSEHQLMIDFIKRTADVVDQEEFLTALQSELPEAYKTLAEFREFLGDEYGGGSSFDEVIRQGANMALLVTRNRISLNDVIHKIKEIVGFNFGYDKKFEGVYHNYARGTIITDNNLSVLLPLLAIKLATVEAQEQVKKRGKKDFLTDLYREQAQRCTELRTELVKEQETALGHEKSTLSQLRSEVQMAEAFKTEVGITDEDIQYLAQLANREKTELDGLPMLRAITYNLLFGALVLHKRGQLNMDSPVFQSFFRTFIKEPDFSFTT